MKEMTLPPAPGVQSMRSRVPAAVPSVTHGSRPWTRSSALKTVRFPMVAKPLGLELSGGGLKMSGLATSLGLAIAAAERKQEHGGAEAGEGSHSGIGGRGRRNLT